MGSLHVNNILAINIPLQALACFVLRGEWGAGSKAFRKLNLIIKQLYKIRELDLLSKGEAFNEENLVEARILHILVTKICSFTFFASVISYESYL